MYTILRYIFCVWKNILTNKSNSNTDFDCDSLITFSQPQQADVKTPPYDLPTITEKLMDTGKT